MIVLVALVAIVGVSFLVWRRRVNRVRTEHTVGNLLAVPMAGRFDKRGKAGLL